jgi:hypothetical protein
MTITLPLEPQEEARLRALAEAKGLTPEVIVREALNRVLAEQSETIPAVRPLQTAADIILSSMRDVPPEIMATMPKDGASQHDHYIYGWPKKET